MQGTHWQGIRWKNDPGSKRQVASLSQVWTLIPSFYGTMVRSQDSVLSGAFCAPEVLLVIWNGACHAPVISIIYPKWSFLGTSLRKISTNLPPLWSGIHWPPRALETPSPDGDHCVDMNKMEGQKWSQCHQNTYTPPQHLYGSYNLYMPFFCDDPGARYQEVICIPLPPQQHSYTYETKGKTELWFPSDWLKRSFPQTQQSGWLWILM